MNDVEPHALRWGLQRLAMGNIRYTKWHWTEDGNFTLCGQAIRIGGEITFFPETYDEKDRVTCKKCLKSLSRH